MFGENVAKVKKGTVDRISELPEFILHNILSILDTREAGRASVLSKRWYQAWSSVPVLDFRYEYYEKEFGHCISLMFGYSVNVGEVQCILGIIDRTMLRYQTQKYRIRKLYLEFPTPNENIELLVDKWIRIAVQNQVEELFIKTISFESPVTRRTPYYRLPEILFRAKSLKVLNCRDIVLPYYETMELTSLEYLTLDRDAAIDTDLLQRILSFCPLVEFVTSTDLEHVSFPWKRKANKGADVFGTETTQSKFKVSPLRKFAYHGFNRVVKWPLNMNVVALKNLKELTIRNAIITDDIVSELAYGLVALESLVLDSCSMLKCIIISSISLKDFRIKEGLDLVKVIIDAPNLIEFWYNCEVETSLSLFRVLEHCNAQFFPLVDMMAYSITTDWFVKLKKVLEETNFFQSLMIKLPDYFEIKEEEDQLRNVVTGPPYKLRELKLHGTFSWDCIPSPLPALDGLFRICHPDVLSITSSEYFCAESILHIMKCKLPCSHFFQCWKWKHPVKSIEVEGIDGSNLHSDRYGTEFRFRLSWL